MIQEDLLLKYLQGECSEMELTEILGWIKSSPENAKILFQMEEIWSMGKLQSYSQEKYLKKAQYKLYAEIEKRKFVHRGKIRLSTFMKYAAAVLLLVGSTLTYHYIGKEDTFQSGQIVSIITSDKVQNYILPDGSKIWLNKHSVLTFSKDFTSDKTRDVTLEGEGYFEVAKDKNKQFIVHTELMNIKVQGTTFNVKAFKGAVTAETSLIEGQILIEGNCNEGSYVLSPGENAEINSDLGVIQISRTDTSLDAVWKDGLFPFNQSNIYEIAESLEQYYNVKIFISPDVNLKNTYSGVLHQKDSIEKVLNSLKNTIQISYKIKGNRIYIDNAVVYRF